MIPPLTHPVWTKLIKGEIEHKFKAASASMLFFTLRQQYGRAPSSLPAQLVEAQRFFEKYERLLADDIKQLFR